MLQSSSYVSLHYFPNPHARMFTVQGAWSTHEWTEPHSVLWSIKLPEVLTAHPTCSSCSEGNAPPLPIAWFMVFLTFSPEHHKQKTRIIPNGAPLYHPSGPQDNSSFPARWAEIKWLDCTGFSAMAFHPRGRQESHQGNLNFSRNSCQSLSALPVLFQDTVLLVCIFYYTLNAMKIILCIITHKSWCQTKVTFKQ